MFSRINSSVVVLLLILIISCTSQRKTTITSQNLIPAPVSQNAGAYFLKPGDKLLINNLNWFSKLFPEPGKPQNIQTASDNGYPVQINSLGMISLPEIGRFHAAGLTRFQLADSLSYRYKDIVRDPIFEVDITNLRVKVLGACNIQGLVALDKETQSLGEVLAKAGGIKYTEAGNKIQIIRGDGKEQQVIEYDFQQLGDPGIMNLAVYDNDIIYVPPSKEGVRSVRLARKLIILQPILIVLNLALIVINITK